MEKTKDIIKFKIGKKYGNYDDAYRYVILKRTEHFITVKTPCNKIKKIKVFYHDNAERAKPEGNYSMCPIICADRISKK